jgi:IS605 OrfB family transposase
MIKQIVEEAYHFGASRIVLGRLRGIRGNSHNGKANTIINNFWSFKVRRFREKLKNTG